MPERRIDAIGKAEAAAWSAIHLAKGSSHLLKIISGQLSHMADGKVTSAVVQKAARGAFKIILNGETFIIKGLPALLLGKEVSFVARRQATASGKGGLELFWLGRGSAKSSALHAGARESSHPHADILSNLPTSLLTRMKAGTVMSGHIDHIQAGKMAVSLSLADAEKPMQSISYQIQTSAVSNLKQGQNISVRIQPGSHNMVLEILSKQQMNSPVKYPVVNSGGKVPLALEMASFTLAAGDITAAVVQRRLANGHVQLNIQGVTVETPAPNTVAQGDLLMLRMEKPPAGFQLIAVQKHAAEKAMSVVKSNLPVSHEPLTQTIATIRNLIQTLPNSDILLKGDMPAMNSIGQLEDWLDSSVPGQQQLSGERLASLIRDSGTGLEAKLLSLMQQPGQSATILQDLKTVFLQLSSLQNGNINHAEIIKALSELSHHGAARIETTQALNVLAHMQGDPVRFELPMLVGQQLVNVQMSVEQQSQHAADEKSGGGKQDQHYSVLFALELSGLGKVRVDASISDQSVHARIYNEQDGVGLFIRNHIMRLETRLHDLGYQDVFLLASRMPPDADKQRRFDQLASMAPASLNLLDVIA